MSLEVLTAKFEAHEQKCVADRLAMASDIKELRIVLDNKVSYKHFYWIIGTLLGLLITIDGYLILQQEAVLSRIDSIGKTAISTQTDVSYLKGKLEPYEVQFPK